MTRLLLLLTQSIALEKAETPTEKIANGRNFYLSDSLTNLGLTYWHSNRLKEAEGAFRDALKLDGERLPATSTVIAQRLSNLAIVLKGNGSL